MQFELVSRRHRRKPRDTDVSRVELQRQKIAITQIDCPHDLRRWCPAPQGTTNVGET
jgi:hypothetical protein